MAKTWYETGTASKWKFTTYERDSESSNDYARARYYVSRLGRFSSPDPLAGSTGNPQSLNRYTYALSAPIGLVDPTGMVPDCTQLKNFQTPTSYEVAGGYSDGEEAYGFSADAAPPPNCGWGGGGGGGDCGTLDGAPLDCSSSPDTGFPLGGVGIVGALQYTFSGSANFHWGDYTLDELLDFASQGEIQVDIGFLPVGIPLNPGPLMGPLKQPPPPVDPIGSALKNLLDLLKDDPDWLAFLSTKQFSAMDVLKTTYEYGSYGQYGMPPTKDAKGQWSMTNALSAGAGPGGTWAMTINTVGAFYASRLGNITNSTDRGRIRGGTPAAQEFILLHELGHDTNALRPDFHNQPLVDANDKDLESHCKKTINSFPH